MTRPGRQFMSRALCVASLSGLGLAACVPRTSIDLDDGGRACPDPQLVCEGACVDGRVDLRNCGGCGVACPQGQFCVDGSCQAQCEPVEVVAAQTLVTLLDGLEYVGLGPYTTGNLPITCDVQVAGSLVIDSTDLSVPATCEARDDCRHAVGFRDRSGTAGVALEGEVGGESGYGDYGRLTITDATVRFRAFLYDTHPSQYNFIPVIDVMPAEDAPCADESLLCGVDRVCYGSAQGYCRYCLALAKEECACFGDEGFAADGSECFFMVSGDVMCQGECQAATCEYTGEPGWAGCP